LKNNRLIIFWIIAGVLFIGILYLLVIFCGLQGGCNNMKAESHLIPDNYIGSVRVIFNVNSGRKKEKQNGKRIYRISNSGVCLTKYSPNTGWLINRDNLKFFYFDSLTNVMNELTRVDWPERVDLSKIDNNSVVIANYGYYQGDFDEGRKTGLTYQVDTLKNFTHLSHYIESMRRQ
jgi:hypothetical protein